MGAVRVRTPLDKKYRNATLQVRVAVTNEDTKAANLKLEAVLLDAASFGGKTTAMEISRILVSSGIHSYLVRRGAQISRALDSRYLLNPTGYIRATR